MSPSARHSARRSRDSRECRSLSPRPRSGCARARLLCYEALWLKDRGEPHGWLAAGAKWLAPELCAEVLHQCILLHGHLGFSLDLPHQQRMRDVIGLEIGDGTAQIMKTIVAREIIGKTARPY